MEEVKIDATAQVDEVEIAFTNSEGFSRIYVVSWRNALKLAAKIEKEALDSRTWTEE